MIIQTSNSQQTFRIRTKSKRQFEICYCGPTANLGTPPPPTPSEEGEPTLLFLERHKPGLAVSLTTNLFQDLVI